MSTDIRPPSTGQIVTGGSAVVNHWEQVVAVARPTLDAVLKLREARSWLADRQKYRRVLIDLGYVDDETEEDAKSRLAIIPELAVLQDAARLFDEAVRKSAPKAWYHLALGTMLASMPNAKNVAPDYQFMVVDVIMYDGESFEKGCQPGFSAPVFVSAIRKVLSEEEFVPTAAKLLKACLAQRQRFRQLASEVEVLIQVRENAEAAVFDEQRFDEDFGLEWTEEDELKFQKIRKNNRGPDDDSDVPF
jgi:hypothetical protein